MHRIAILFFFFTLSANMLSAADGTLPARKAPAGKPQPAAASDTLAGLVDKAEAQLDAKKFKKAAELLEQALKDGRLVASP